MRPKVKSTSRAFSFRQQVGSYLIGLVIDTDHQAVKQHQNQHQRRHKTQNRGASDSTLHQQIVDKTPSDSR